MNRPAKTKVEKIQAVRGMNDLLPEDSPAWQYLEALVADVVQRYAYREIRFPILDQTELFKRSIGEVTDIVEKEMYTFLDRNELSLTLRPEGTASCVRACEQHGLLYNQVQRLWYMGPMFRYEKPQKGRLRQFHQIGVEAFGIETADIDAELLVVTARLWEELGISDAVTLQLNTLGTLDDRKRFKADLVSYLDARKDQLDEDSQRRLATNPLRILDSKNSDTQALLNDAPSLMDYIDADSLAHFEQLKTLLDAAGIAYEINPRLVRGLDYYGKTVFEWVTTRLGAQGTVCAGGRYDGLVEQLGGRPVPAVGFAMGIERLVLLLQELDVLPVALSQSIDAYFICDGDVTVESLKMAEQIRSQIPWLRLQVHCGGGKFKRQMKKAVDSGASLALVLNEDGAASGSLTLKFLSQEKEQTTLPLQEAISLMQAEINE